MKGFLLLLLVIITSGVAILHRNQEYETALHVLDVGQGDAILLRHGALDILVDGGPDTTVLRRLGEARPFWDRTIDVLVLTHPQQDHLRGLLDIIDRERIGVLLLPEIPATSETFRTFIDRLIERGVRVQAAHAGQVLRHGDLRVDVLAPDVELLRRARQNANIGSIVLRAEVPEFSVLLTGDIEAPTEQHLIRHHRAELDVDILKVPHHGSKTSSTPGFLSAVTPLLSIASLGENNRYGHPHAAVLERYRRDAFFRSDRMGTVSVIGRRGQMFVRCARGCGQR